jgi:hypothetical protein
MDVDEADVSGLRLGERAYATAWAFGDRKFWGKVVQVGKCTIQSEFLFALFCVIDHALEVDQHHRLVSDHPSVVS